MRKISHRSFSVRNSMRKISHHPFSMRTQCEKFCITFSHYKNFRTATSQCENFRITISHQKSPFRISQTLMRKILHQPLAMRNANDHLMARREVKSHSNFLFKGLQLTISHKRPLLGKAHCRLVKQIPHHSTPHGHQEEEEQSTSRPYQLWCAPEEAI